MIMSKYKPKYSYRKARKKLNEAIDIIHEVSSIYGCRAGNAIQEINGFCIWLYKQEYKEMEDKEKNE